MTEVGLRHAGTICSEKGLKPSECISEFHNRLSVADCLDPVLCVLIVLRDFLTLSGDYVSTYSSGGGIALCWSAADYVKVSEEVLKLI